MRNVTLVLLVLGVFSAFGCPSTSNRDAEAAAEAAAKVWLSLVDSERYEESWDEAAELFKGAVSQHQWRQSMLAARKPLGKSISRELKSRQYRTSIPGAPDGEYVVIRFQSSFEKKTTAVETVTPMMGKDGKWRVSGYYIK